VLNATTLYAGEVGGPVRRSFGGGAGPFLPSSPLVLDPLQPPAADFSPWVYGFSFRDGDNGFLCGGNGFGFPNFNTGFIQSTSDKGANWVTIPTSLNITNRFQDIRMNIPAP
jgi:hypothetical protein